jgi:3-hydroxyisobutyrate dehydrogenase-like beta-hydroxyacid dehydrogenase
MMVSFSEGLLLSEKVGLDPNTLVEVISQGAISAPMFSLKGPSMVKAAYPTAFPLKHQQKVAPTCMLMLPALKTSNNCISSDFCGTAKNWIFHGRI